MLVKTPPPPPFLPPPQNDSNTPVLNSCLSPASGSGLPSHRNLPAGRKRTALFRLEVPAPAAEAGWPWEGRAPTLPGVPRRPGLRLRRSKRRSLRPLTAPPELGLGSAVSAPGRGGDGLRLCGGRRKPEFKSCSDSYYASASVSSSVEGGGGPRSPPPIPLRYYNNTNKRSADAPRIHRPPPPARPLDLAEVKGRLSGRAAPGLPAS